MIGRLSKGWTGGWPGALRLGAAGALLIVAGALLIAADDARAADVSEDLPVLGDASSSLISPEMERQIGSEFLKQLHASLPTIDDPILKYWVGVNLADLVQHSQLRDSLLQVVLIDNPEINAFAAPGGVVGINLGLMLYAEDVNEYSSVLAHELAHLSQRHFARGVEEQRAQTLPTLASMIAAIAIGVMGGGDAGIAAMSAAQAASQSSQLRYSRTREQEADRIGLNTLVRAGLDPNGMSRMFERMQRAYRYSSRPPEFLLTHPLSESRVADARLQAQEYPARSYPDSLDYALMRTRAIVHYADSPQAAVKRFSKEVEDHPDSEAARYGLAIALSKAGEHTEAVALADQLFSKTPEKILYIAAYGDILTAAGKYDQAEKLLSHHLAINPDNPALAMVYADALTKSGQYREAQAVLERQSKVNGNDVDVWYDLAEVSGQAGDIIGVHRARAEYFALHGAYQQAIQHLEYARRLVSRADTQLLARLDQRLYDLRTALREARS
ncbi:MAG: M48 family metalloprotease [Pseudomonadales bacterium]